MEWIIGKGSNEVDIGYVPLMKLYSPSSVLWEENMRTPPNNDSDYLDINWDEEITLPVAMQEIEKEFYPFKKVIVEAANF